MAASYRRFRDLDWLMIAIALSICALGVLQIFSATRETRWETAWWRQILFIGAGLVLLWLVTTVDYHTLLAQVPVYYVLLLLMMILVLVAGTKVFGSRRWIPLFGGFHFQVSEFGKLVIVLLVARYLTNQKREQLEGKEILKVLVLTLIPMALVMRQPDLGTALTYLPIFAMGVYLAGLRMQQVVICGVIALVIPFAAYYFVLHDYQRGRVDTFLDPALDPKGKGYQVIQSQIAVGSGRLWGRGVTQGSQTQGRFLPVPHTDFIFAAFGEEHGFVGVSVVLVLYLLLLLQVVQSAQSAPDRAGMYICMGVAALLLFHMLVNVGMVVGRMPVTGIPLPLMSYGGSNTLSMFMMLGLVNNVRLRRFVS
ncbi:MAG: rod shape-determining protein RodA [Bryobacteraceae bacterium]